MQREYRKVIQNIQLTKEEAQTLHDAQRILEDALKIIFDPACPFDADLIEAINQGIDGLKVCNPRLNVDAIVHGKQ